MTRDVRERHGPGRPWSTQAVLVRTNAQAVVITEALGRAGIPHRLRGADQLLTRPAVADAWPACAGSATRPCSPTCASPPVAEEGAERPDSPDTARKAEEADAGR